MIICYFTDSEARVVRTNPHLPRYSINLLSGNSLHEFFLMNKKYKWIAQINLLDILWCLMSEHQNAANQLLLHCISQWLRLVWEIHDLVSASNEEYSRISAIHTNINQKFLAQITSRHIVHNSFNDRLTLYESLSQIHIWKQCIT